MFNYLKDKWNKFECWVHTWFPGIKTKAVLLMGTVGQGAALLQEFFSGLPTADFISTKTLSLISLALFVLAFWFKNMGERVDAIKNED